MMKIIPLKIGSFLFNCDFSKTFLVFLVVIISTHTAINTGVRVCAGVLAITGLLAPTLLCRLEYWFTLSWILTLNLFLNYSISANHYWLSVYVSWSFFIESLSTERIWKTETNLPRSLLKVLFFFATLQKLLSTYFLSGRLLVNYVINGSSLYLFFSQMDPDHEKITRQFNNNLISIAQQFPEEGLSHPIYTLDPDILTIVCVFTVFVILYEFVMFLAVTVDIIFDCTLSQLLFAGFLWGTLMVRSEFAFFSLLSILFLMSKPKMGNFWKAFFFISFCLFLSLEMGT